MNTPEPTYKVPPFTTMELVMLRCAIREDICRFWKWRHDPSWRNRLRECVSAYRKLQQREVCI